ncbi:Arylsulfatase [hydrothermal vent metagenome]|uniref:Arylsulfatase n=1 Tax=hydrothermal vent metagenome TaxID=652676 RepID=A0A3B0RUG4_9ZZZZ
MTSSGMRFSNAYSANPVCSPTRASIMTGKNPARLHITDYIPGSPYPYARLLRPGQVPPLPEREVTIAEMMKTKGYTTGHFGKWHLNKDKKYVPGRPMDPGSQGFDDVLTTKKPGYDADPSADAHHTAEITDRASKFIDRNRNNPFFAYISFNTVHRPIMEKSALIAKYKAKTGADDPVNNPVMGAMLETMDNGIGRILARLEEDGLTDHTIVVFYSDNGGFEQLQKQDPFRGGKAMIWEGGIRVPLAIKWPGVVKAGTVDDSLVISDDFFPTIADILDIKETPADIDGKSLVPLLKQTGKLDRDALYFDYPHFHHLGYKPAGAIRQGDYKLVEWFEGTIAGVGKAYSLFNIAKDPGEEHDLSVDMPDRVKSMSGKLRNWRKKVGADEMTLNPDYDPKRANWRFKDRQGGNAK